MASMPQKDSQRIIIRQSQDSLNYFHKLEFKKSNLVLPFNILGYNQVLASLQCNHTLTMLGFSDDSREIKSFDDSACLHVMLLRWFNLF